MGAVVTSPFATLVVALLAGTGAYLVVTAVLFGWRGRGPGLRSGTTAVRRRTARDVLAQAGLGSVRPGQFVGVSAVAGLLLGALAFGVFGGWLVTATVAVIGAIVPAAVVRRRQVRRREQAREVWPRLLEELRLQVTSVGRSVPQALVEVGARAPVELRPAFAASAREWQRTTDLDRALDVLKAQLADPAADAVCETLLVAHEVGGRDVDRRLRELVADRIVDVQQRRDARAKQAGARFARSFVLVVPLGMAGVGLTIGDGRDAYAGATAQLVVLAGIAGIAACWWWAGRLLRLPEPDRVFTARSERVADGAPRADGRGADGTPASGTRAGGAPSDGRWTEAAT